MTTVFRSCLPQFYSITNLSENSMDCLSIISNDNITTNQQFNILEEKQSELLPLKTKKLIRKRGPRYTRINEKTQPFLTRLIGTMFGDYEIITKNKKRNKKSLLPSKSIIEKQFEDNEQTLHSLVTALTQIESNNNNNRIDDTLTENNSHFSLRKMIDNQQQTQFYPIKITTETSTQFNDTNTSESSWLDLMRDDQTTINAWARIRRRLKPNQQKDILRALMIICANLFDVPLENKHI